ncbi:hypothetical protein FH972_023674 [Carpinus fangiana]|uniref:Uncharacterized protein n=1 Tax=Carpinus fangiana TaxID=176857 RepID=A0A5N6KVV5_9ROSI|nr:hypothetical protein FH972_023674 [Carpinus fangiana]
MSYTIYYSISFLLFLSATVLFFTRHHWLPVLPSYQFPWRYQPLSEGTFHDDAAAGLHSSNFDLASNIEAGDSRAGLDEAGKREVRRIMKKKNVGFDEARRLVMLDKFKKGGVGQDGLPRDPKLVTFS